MIYFDNNATTKTAPEVYAAMIPYMTGEYGNPSSGHRFGGHLSAEICRARERVASLLGALPEEIVFTSGGTESNVTAILSVLSVRPDCRRIVISSVEHASVRNLCLGLEDRGYDVAEIPVDAFGRLDLDVAAELITPGTALVSVMWANNETGNIYPVAEIGELAHRAGALFHTDAVQAAGKIPMRLDSLPVDMFSLSGHKFYGPKGIGALFVKRGVPFHSLMTGGHQERGCRAGTENVAGIVGQGIAAELAQQTMDDENGRVRSLRDKLEAGILARIPQTRINGDPLNRLPNTLNVSFDGISGEGLLALLDIRGICASGGSACLTGSLEPSHVLRAMNLPENALNGAVRFSLGRYNTEQEIDTVLSLLPEIVSQLRI